MKQFFENKEEGIGVAISLEEEALIISEIQDSFAETQTAFDEVARLADIQQGVEDVREINASCEPGSVETQLAEAVADMAVAGTDSNATELFAPVTEDVLVTEGFADKAFDALKALWEAIKAAIEKAKAAIKKFFDNLHYFISPTKRRLERAKKEQEEKEELQRTMDEIERKRHAAAMEKYRRTSFRYPGKISRLMYNDIPSDMVATHVHGLRLWTENKLMDYNAHMVPIAEMLDTHVKLASKDLEYFNLDSFTEKFYDVVDRNLSTAGLAKSGASGNGERIGGIGFEYSLKHWSHKDDVDTKTKIYRLSNFGVFTPKNDESRSTSGNVKVLSEIDRKSIIDTVSRWTEFLEKNQSSFCSKKLDKLTETIKSDVNNLFNKHWNNNFDDNATIKTKVKTLVAITDRIIEATLSPQARLIKNVTDVMNEAMNYVLACNAHEASIAAEDKAKNEDSKKVDKEEEQEDNSFKPSRSLAKFVQEKDASHVRTALIVESENKLATTSELLASINWASKRIPDLWEKYEEKSFARKIDTDQNAWNEDYLGTQYVYLDTNFSKERFMHILKVREYLQNK